MDDFIFDDEVDEVGSEVEAFCPKCKTDTAHVVIHKYEDEIRRVQCNPCGDIHPFRKPRGELEEETIEPATTKKRTIKAKPTWEQAMAKTKREPKLYIVSEQYREGDVISHPKFGLGFVSEEIPPQKIEVTFEDEPRILIHGREGMSLPPAAYAQTIDATAALGKKKGAKGKNLPSTLASAPKSSGVKTASAKSVPVKSEAGKTGAKAVVKPAVKSQAKLPAATKKTQDRKPALAQKKAPPAKLPAKAAAPAAKEKPAKKAPAPAKKPAKPSKAVVKQPAKPAPKKPSKPVKPAVKKPARPAKPAPKKPAKKTKKH